MKVLTYAVALATLYFVLEIGSAFLPGRGVDQVRQNDPCRRIALPNTVDEAVCRIQMRRAAEAIEEAH